MSKAKTVEIIALVEGAGVNQYDQRSALGVARSWMDSGEFAGAGPGLENLYGGRDRLARSLVAALEGVPRGEQLVALASAREKVNAPFLDPAMMGFQAARAKRGVVGSLKKNEKNAKA
jgi:hypothetical protein